MVDRLEVSMGGHRVGTLERAADRTLRFAYDHDWIERPDATPLSVSMPLRPGPFAHGTVHPYLWGLLPDNEDVIDRWARQFQCSPSDVFALLTNVGVDVAGAALYLPPGSDPEVAAAASYERLTEDEVGHLLREVADDAAAWHPRDSRGRWSLAGAQAKIALAHSPSLGWAIPSGRAPTTHILKPAIDRLDDHDLNELLCVRAAAELGLVTEAAVLGHFGDRRALVVTRYDRTEGPSGQIVRVHQEDLCQALSVHPNRKYQSDGGPSVEDMVGVLRLHSTSPWLDVARLLDTVAYNWLVLGTDAHAKNHSLVLSGQQVRLAPLYDVASLAPYVPFAPKAKLAQKVGGEYRAGKIAARHWERLARAAKVDPGELVDRIRDLAARVPRALSEAIAGSGLDDDERRVATEQAERIAAWTATAVQQLGGPGSPAPIRQPSVEERRPPARHPSGTPKGGRFAPRPDDPADEGA
jgi:serine/threonine-protein kinase HipA